MRIATCIGARTAASNEGGIGETIRPAINYRRLIHIRTSMQQQPPLAGLRKKACLSQSELGHFLGVHESTVSRVENGQALPSLKFAMGCKLLFGGGASKNFPSVAVAVRGAVLDRLATFSIQLEHEVGDAAERRRAFLRTIAERENYEDVALAV